MSVYETIRREVERGLQRAGNHVRRGILSVAFGSDFFGQVRGHDGETWQDVELWQQFGLASRPPAGGEVALVELDGGSEQAVAVATQDRAHRPTTAAGEVVLHSEDDGDQATVRMKPDGTVEVDAPGGRISLEPGGSAFVEVGEGATVKMLLGETFDSDLSDQVMQMLADFKTWNDGSKTLADANILIDNMWSALWAFFQAGGGTGTKTDPGSHTAGTDWVATKGKVK